MAGCLAETGVAVIGGDQRQSMVLEELANRAAWVKTFCLSYGSSPRVMEAESLEDAISGAGAIVFPISGVSNEGKVRLAGEKGFLPLPGNFIETLEPGTVIMTGSSPADWKRQCEALQHIVIDYAELDEVAIPNAIPTAEGAIQLAMQGLPVTLCRNDFLILGFGRVAKALAKMLLGIGARVFVAARRRAQQEEASEMGCQAVAFSDLATLLTSVWAVFNTVPARVLTAEHLSVLRKDAMVIDLASAPGGTDFDAAKVLGISAILALGLPGKVAPRTAGEILASTIPNLLDRALTR
ncbi:MAG TPA: dipicolinate synthase subunit DpsA [Bacillota bacterium]|nr:dipicolinate synthase subunit DpsA [Bacillota bacterium]